MKTRKNLNVWLAMSMFLLLMVSTAMAEIIYVDADANSVSDGSSWTNAYNYLQDALADASSGDEIWVAEGIYKPDQGVGITPGDRTATFQLINGVTLKGGYAGLGEPDANERDIDEYETMLSGDLAGNDVEVDDPRDLLLHPSRVDNVAHVVTGSGTDGTAILDGFTVTGGHFYAVPGSSSTPWGGGGMYNDSGSPTVMNCTFSENCNVGEAGGMYNYNNSNPTVTSCTFTRNGAYCGGGMSNQDNSNTILTNCIFSGNSATFGGGIYDYNSNPTLINCTFNRNKIYNDQSNPTVSNSILLGHRPIYDDEESTTVITYSNVKRGWPGVGNIDVDPCFADPNNGDYHLKSEAGRWEPSSQSWVVDEVTSPCIDAGNTMSPIGDEPFPNGGIINMGAYGGTVEASKSYFGEPVCETIVAGDINGDCRVNFEDFAFMAYHWLEDGTLLPPSPAPPPLPPPLPWSPGNGGPP